MPYQTPLASIVTSSIGRGAELKYGPGNNQYARASDVNPIIDYIDSRAGVNAGTVTQATSTSTGVTLNSYAGIITMFAGTIAASGNTSFTLTNSNITSTSIVQAQIVQGGAAGSLPVVVSVVPSNGSAVITIANVSTATATGANSLKISFIVL